MNPGRQDEQAIRDWLARDAPFELDDLVLDATYARTRRTRQTVRRWEWRPQAMNRSLAIAAGAVAIAFAVIGASLLLRAPSPSVGAQPSNLPTGSPAAVSPSGGAASPTLAISPSSGPIKGPSFSLAIVNRDGTVRQDLGLPPDAWMADMNSDGTRLAFLTTSPTVGDCGGCGAGTQRLAILDVGATQGAFLYPDSGLLPIEPAWSPDGTRLAYVAGGDIYVVTPRPNGTVLQGTATRVTTDPSDDEFPTWTPDGKAILYDNLGTGPVDDGGFSDTQEIWSVPAAGGTPTRLTQNDQADAFPDVAADGTVVFWRRGQIWTMDQIGGHAQLRYEGANVYNPRWSPDSRTLALLEYDPNQRVQTDFSLGMVIDQPKMNVVLLDLASRKLTAVGPSVASDLNPVTWTTDGGALLIDRVVFGR